LCWHIDDGKVILATGYVTVSMLHDAPAIREAWASALGLERLDGEPGFGGQSGPLAIHLPDAVDPDEHCLVCGQPFDPRDTQSGGRGRYQGGDVCRSCASAP